MSACIFTGKLPNLKHCLMHLYSVSLNDRAPARYAVFDRWGVNLTVKEILFLLLSLFYEIGNNRVDTFFQEGVGQK